MCKKRVSYRWVLYLILIIIIGILFQYNRLIYTKVYPVYRTIKGYGILQGVSHYESEQIKNFSIRYDSSDIDDLDNLEKIIGKYGDRVFEFFNFVPDKDIEIILFNNKEELHKNLGIPEYQSTVGAYSGGKIALLAHQDDGISDDVLVNSFVHELTHLVIDELAGGNFPIWFTEGSALYMENELLDYEWGQELEGMELYSIEELTDSFAQLDEYQAYRQAFVNVRQLMARAGRDKFLNLLKNLRDGRSFSSEFIQF